MKNLFLVGLFLSVAAISGSAFANDNHRLRKVVISFSEQDAKNRLPASEDEKAVVEAQARHVAQSKALDAALENLD